MKGTVPVATGATAKEPPLPARVQEALGERSGPPARAALSVGVGLRVVHELIEEELGEVVGPKGRHDPERTAVRHGHEEGELTLGGRRVPVRRPRARAADRSGEVELSVYRHFAARDLLEGVELERMLAGVSTRRYRGTNEPMGGEVEAVERSISKSAVSRTFIERTRETLADLMRRRLDDVRLAVLGVRRS